MGYLPYSCGYKRLTSSGLVSDSGKPILIAGASVLSGGTAAVPYFINGTAASAGNDIAFRGEGTANVARITCPSELPVMLPNGCFVSFDANTTEVSVFYVLQSVSS